MAEILICVLYLAILYGSVIAVQNITCTTNQLKVTCKDNCCWEEVHKYVYCCMKDTDTKTEAVAYSGVAVVSFVFLVLLLSTIVYFTCWTRLKSKPLDDGNYPMKTFIPTHGFGLEPQPRPQTRYTTAYDEVNLYSQPGTGATRYTSWASMAD
ncbi:hypothetical protein DPMN_191201 [Dreissena polymorpha]|uniref:Uncharacterized protein n=1 Tax=Dreissena polymorpha TaxID=45954 RepID=A0A9D3XYW2_DREPO|nr:hypothetical protein DPMN_191201 [Dreissena polymorpha]